MLNITVKTLDSQNHPFTCEEDITVRGFKEHIAETVSVAVESQRLIYCGRVLQDDKKLNEYDVDGKVIHLVQRAPPQPGSRSSSTDRQQRSTTQGWTLGTPRVQFSRGLHRNVYMGAMAVPTEVVENNGLPAPQLSNTLSNSRLLTARCMLNKVSQLMDRMDDPSLPLHPSPTENNSSESTRPQPSAPEEEQLGNENDSLGDDRRRVVLAASNIAAAFSAAALNYIRVADGATEDGNSTNSNSTTSTSQPEHTPRDQVQQDESSTQESDQQRQQSEIPNTSRSSNENEDHGSSSRRTAPIPRPPQMAELLNSLLSTQARLRPFIERYQSLMTTDPALTADNGPESVAENQRIVDGVSESLHYLSHACHALSDIIVDMGQQPPRNLRCRPIIIQHSTILQAGIPIQVESHINLNRNTTPNNNNATDEGGEAPRETSPTSSTQQRTSRPSSVNNRQVPPRTSLNLPTASSLLGTLLLPSNVEVSMELSPPTALDLSSPSAMEGSENDQGQSNNNNINTNGGLLEGSGASLNSTPFALIREAIRSVINERQSQTETSTTTTINLPFVMDLNTNSGQSTQARSNIGTHPTTSTQTRSTARPHVLHPQTHPLNMGMGMGMDHNLEFDPFLPCYSHHVRRTPPNSANSTTSRANRRNQTNTSAERRSRSQSDSRSSSSSTRTIPHVNFTVGGDINLTRDFLENDSQAIANGLAMTLGEILQGATNSGDVHISVIGGSNSGEVHMTPTNDVPLIELLRSFNIRAEDFGENRTFLLELWLFVLRNFTTQSIVQLGMGQTEPLINIRRPLREFFEHSFPNESGESLQKKIVDEIVDQLIGLNQAYLRLLGASQAESASRRVDIPATISALLRSFFEDFIKVLFCNDYDDTLYATHIKSIARRFEEHSSAVLQYILGGREPLETITSRIFSQMTEGTNPFFQQFMVEVLSTRLRSFATRSWDRSADELAHLLVFVDEQTPAPLVEPVQGINRSETGTFRIPVSAKQRQQKNSQKEDQQGPSNRKETEPDLTPMDVDRAELDLELSNEIENDPKDLANGEEIQETFPGAENLPSDWVPIIARDSARQRRQVQINNLGGGPIPFSDAYLSCMPSKRRKLIEQQKPQLLVTPTPTNANSIAASVERLVRDGMVHSQVEEVEGAAHAVAAVPEVRTAFGQAIRDCLGPSRLQTIDFPNPRRFPNASRFFGEGGNDDSAGTTNGAKK